jgi:hypothetical protein
VPSPKQAKLLIRFGYSYEEIRDWEQGYAGLVLRQILENKKRKVK